MLAHNLSSAQHHSAFNSHHFHINYILTIDFTTISAAMAEPAVPTNRDSVPLSEPNLTRPTATPVQPQLLKRVAQNLAATITKPFSKKVKTVDYENAHMIIVKVEDYGNDRYDRLERSGMRFIATYIDPDTRSISSRGIGTYRMYFSHFDLACYIEKEAFVPASSDGEDDGPRPSVPLPGNGVPCQIKTFDTSDGNVYFARQRGNGVWSYGDASNLSVRQHIVHGEEAVVDKLVVSYFRLKNGQPEGA